MDRNTHTDCPETTRYSGELAPLRPETCPCCGAAMAWEKMIAHKRREFAYQCGALGWQTEKYYYDPNGELETQPTLRQDTFWTHACPRAMSHFAGSKSLSG